MIAGSAVERELASEVLGKKNILATGIPLTAGENSLQEMNSGAASRLPLLTYHLTANFLRVFSFGLVLREVRLLKRWVLRVFLKLPFLTDRCLLRKHLSGCGLNYLFSAVWEQISEEFSHVRTHQAQT